MTLYGSFRVFRIQYYEFWNNSGALGRDCDVADGWGGVVGGWFVYSLVGSVRL